MENTNTIGSVKIAEEVIASIASITALNISGVSSMSSGIIDGITGFLGKKSVSKGVKITLGEEDVAVELSLVVDYGCKIPDVAWDVQQSVKREIETMTGLNVTKVDIRVEGTNIISNKEEVIPAAVVESMQAVEAEGEASAPDAQPESSQDSQ